LSAADNASAGENEKGAWRCLDQALEPIPTCLWNFAQFLKRIQNEIQNNEWKITIAQKEISGFNCFKRFGTTNPE